MRLMLHDFRHSISNTVARIIIFAQVVIGMDVAASEFYDGKDKTYDLNFKEEVRKEGKTYIFTVSFFR